MIDHLSVTTPSHGSPSRVSWGSVFAGVVVASALMFCLCELGMAFGLSMLKPQDPGQDPSLATIAVTGAVAWIGSILISLFAGGWTAAHLARQSNETDSVIHGLLVWGLGTLTILVLAASAAGALMGGAFSLVSSGIKATGSAVGGTMQGAGSAMGSVVQEVGKKIDGQVAFNWDSIKYQAQSLLKKAQMTHDKTAASTGAQPPAGDQNPGQSTNAPAAGAKGGTDPVSNQTKDGTQPSDKGADQQNGSGDALALVQRFFGNPGKPLSEEDRSTLLSMLAAYTGMTRDEATKQVQQWEAAAQKASAEFEKLKAEAEQKARAAAAVAAKSLASAAWLSFVATVLAASAAMVGAYVGGIYTARVVRHDRVVTAAVV